MFALAQKSPEAAHWSRASYDELASIPALAWVAEVSGKISGFIVARTMETEAEILNIAVEDSSRRSGLGTALLECAYEKLLSAGVNHLFLEVRESNITAQRFYEKNGFAKIGSRRGYYQDPPESAVLMEKKLTG